MTPFAFPQCSHFYVRVEGLCIGDLWKNETCSEKRNSTRKPPLFIDFARAQNFYRSLSTYCKIYRCAMLLREKLATSPVVNSSVMWPYSMLKICTVLTFLTRKVRHNGMRGSALFCSKTTLHSHQNPLSEVRQKSFLSRLNS